MQPERGREQRIVERHEFQAIRVVAPRGGKGTVVSSLTRQIALDGERKCPREEEARYGHQSLEALGALLPEISVGFLVGFQQIREDRLQMQYLVDVDTPPV